MTWKLDKVKKIVNCLENLTLNEDNSFDLNHFNESYGCNTIACALGWFYIKEPKLFFEGFEDENEEGPRIFTFDTMHKYFIDDSTYEERTLFGAIFGLNIKDAYRLYKKHLSNISKEDVVEQLKKLL